MCRFNTDFQSLIKKLEDVHTAVTSEEVEYTLAYLYTFVWHNTTKKYNPSTPPKIMQNYFGII